MPADRIFNKEALEEGQIIPFNKPVDWTSFDVVNKLRHITHIKKIGHAGTLDPFATGLLLICFGKATKKVESLIGLEKEYIGVIQVGAETDTHDRTGEIVKSTPVSEILSEEKIKATLSKFQGEIQQVPPMYSALKYKGKKLYSLARKGRVVKREPRSVQIYKISLLNLDGTELKIQVICSKGTYIRALARDIGRELGYGGYLKALTRTRIGQYTLEDAWGLKTYEKEFKEYNT